MADDPIKTLVDMGLTTAEARIYCVTLKMGGGSAREISTASKMERAYTYNVLRRLEDIGIVEATLSSPISFRSLSAAEATDHLLSLQTSKLERMKKQKESLIENIGFQKGGTRILDDKIFSIVTGRANNRLKAINTIRNCQSEITMLQSSQGLARLWRSIDFLDIVRQKRKDGVKIRMITELVPANIEAVKEFSSICTLRHARNQVANATVYDRRSCSIVLRIGENLRSDTEEHTSLWTNSVSFINTMSNFFDTMWSVAKPYSVGDEEKESFELGTHWISEDPEDPTTNRAT